MRDPLQQFDAISFVSVTTFFLTHFLFLFSRLTDLLDERKLTKDELRDFAGLLFGEAVMLDGLPDPQADWNGFRKEIDSLQKTEKLVYNPISSKLGPWMNHGMIY